MNSPDSGVPAASAGFRFTAHPRERVVEVTVTGRVQAATLTAAYEHLLNEVPGFSRLWDYRNASLEGLSFDDLRGITAYVADRESTATGAATSCDGVETRVYSATVVKATLDFGISRTYEMLAERTTVTARVFRDRDEAWEWLVTRPR